MVDNETAARAWKQVQCNQVIGKLLLTFDMEMLSQSLFLAELDLHPEGSSDVADLLRSLVDASKDERLADQTELDVE